MSEQVTTGAILVTDTQADPRQATVSVGLDAGRGQTHLVGTNPLAPETTLEVVFPSVATVYGFSAAELLRKRAAGPGEWGRFGSHEHVARFDDELLDTAVGDLALARGNLGEPITNGWDDPDRYARLCVRLGLVGLAALYPQAERLTVNLATGLPVRLWTPERARAVEAAWRRTHAYTYKDRELTVRVASCRVLAEGHAAWVTLPADRKLGTRLGVDIGARTVIACQIGDGTVENTYELPWGVDVVLTQLDRHLEGQGLRALSLRERYQLRDAMVAGAERFEIAHAGGRVDVLAPARTLFAQAGAAIVRELASQMDLSQFDGADYSGGGVLFMGESIMGEHRARGLERRAFLADEPERRTARGYFQQLTGRLGQGKKKGRRA